MTAPILAHQVGLTREDTRRIAEAGCDLLSGGQLDLAADIFKGLLALDPNDAFAHTAYGVILTKQGDDDAALARFDAALEQDPAMPVALLNRGILMLKRGDLAGLNDLKAVAGVDSHVSASARQIVSAFAQR